MKKWVLKTNNGQYLCHGYEEDTTTLRFKCGLLEESNLIFSEDKTELQELVDNWNKDACEALQVKPTLVEFMVDEVKEDQSKLTNAEKYTTKEDRLQAFYEMCDKNMFKDCGGGDVCRRCKYKETCGGAHNQANAILSWLEDEVEDIPYEVTRTYTKTIIVNAVSKDEARRFAEKRFKELEETKTIKEASLKHEFGSDKIIPDLSYLRSKILKF